MDLFSSVRELHGVGPARAAQLEKLGITAAGAVLTDADDKFLRAYYGK